MQMRNVLLAHLTALAGLASGCKTVDCGDGTTERNGSCVPANETVTVGKCGPFTELHGDTCVPMFPPTTCDPGTTQPDTDTSTGVTTCIGTGVTNCSAKLACPTPADSTKQIICGQVYDFETGLPFAAAGATGTQCKGITASGPCSLGIQAFDAVLFATNPTATPPLATDPFYIDDCGRYKLSGVTQPTGPIIALAFDDPAMSGVAGTSNPVGIATAKAAGQATKDLDAFIVRGAVAAGWGTPMLASGIYAAVYRGHRTGADLAAGVLLTIGPANTVPTAGDVNRDFYFAAGATARTTLDTLAAATGVNGTALLSGANLGEAYSGKGGGLPATCMWEVHAGAAIPGVVFIQTFRPTDIPGMTCPL
jgi:hypothetical protein